LTKIKELSYTACISFFYKLSINLKKFKKFKILGGKTKMIKKIIALLLTAALMTSMLVLLPGCSDDGEKGQLRVGMECDYAPFNWTQSDTSNGAVSISNDSTGFAAGYDVEIAKKIAADLKMELVIVKIDWDGLIPALRAGTIDIIIAGMSPTGERKEVIDFSDYYFESELVIVVKKDGPYANAASLADFSGAKITGQLNTTHYDMIDQIPSVDKQGALPTFPTMMTSLKSDFIDGYVSERPGASAAARAHSDLTFVEFEADKGFIYDRDEVNISIGISKGNDLLSKINTALAKISTEERENLMIDALANMVED